MPALPPPVRQPVPDDQADLAAKTRAQQQLYGLGGRESTNLTGNQTFVSDVLGK